MLLQVPQKRNLTLQRFKREMSSSTIRAFRDTGKLDSSNLQESIFAKFLQCNAYPFIFDGEEFIFAGSEMKYEH